MYMKKLYVTLVIALVCYTHRLAIAALTSTTSGLHREPFSRGARQIETLSWSPRAFLYHNFLSDEEADHIISTARPSMHRSTVLGVDGKDETNEVRTSYGTFLSRFQDQILTNVQKRVELWTQLNVSHQEDMQVLRYGVGQKYSPHYDSIVEESPRMATVLLYLTDVEQGGETSFPNSNKWVAESLVTSQGPLSPCAGGSISVKPNKGDALLFYSMHPNGTMDSASLHTGCPVLKGVKWTATIWIHTAPFRLQSLGKDLDLPRYPDECKDYNEMCPRWAGDGECQNNPDFMVGDVQYVGTCRLSCGVCQACKQGDVQCKNKNRIRAGYLSLDDYDDM